jgi:hypothetical protein
MRLLLCYDDPAMIYIENYSNFLNSVLFSTVSVDVSIALGYKGKVYCVLCPRSLPHRL